jgi:4-alpha-glucanotransferase
MPTRTSGLLLHITSLPSRFGIGDLGPEARAFADFLGDSGQSLWQVLPVNPVDGACGNSPYSSISAFAGNTLLVSPERMVEGGLLDSSDLKSAPAFAEGRADYDGARRFREPLFRKAYSRFAADERFRSGFEAFRERSAGWLDEYVRFLVLKRMFGGAVWCGWPSEYRDRDSGALSLLDRENREEYEYLSFLQYVFFSQWNALRAECAARNIRIIGDIPIYVNYDSPEVWAHPERFRLDSEKRPAAVAGVPPDYFSSTGQLWGNPVYDWKALCHEGYAFWIDRLAHNLALFDLVRIDHFRGLVAFWEVPFGEKTAVNGKWVKAPVRELFDTLRTHFPALPVLAEDLGVITPDVRAVMSAYGFPGMKVLLFAFGDSTATNPYIPHNHIPPCVIYTGTHDNNTVRGWFDCDASESEKENLFRYLGRRIEADRIAEEFMRLAYMSVADTAIVPVQDMLGLGAEARMNTPSVARGNWEWRLAPGALTPEIASRLKELAVTYGRYGVEEDDESQSEEAAVYGDSVEEYDSNL